MSKIEIINAIAAGINLGSALSLLLLLLASSLLVKRGTSAVIDVIDYIKKESDDLKRDDDAQS